MIFKAGIFIISVNGYLMAVAFGIYFIGQHSLTGWRHIKNHIGWSHKQLWLHALPFHFGAWLLLLQWVWVKPNLLGEIFLFS